MSIPTENKVSAAYCITKRLEYDLHGCLPPMCSKHRRTEQRSYQDQKRVNLQGGSTAIVMRLVRAPRLLRHEDSGLCGCPHRASALAGTTAERRANASALCNSLPKYTTKPTDPRYIPHDNKLSLHRFHVSKEGHETFDEPLRTSHGRLGLTPPIQTTRRNDQPAGNDTSCIRPRQKMT
ncbi:uncharacterized protein BDZ99DRAFT_273350 [Mytilinidion resinicola]|uniref:Uncharacterized protein n=1 Tax=Mytilinidion resinicola TaxID=574789 RepID=A0A6A6YWJ1_9PEZI|nr:uncharacterized protein BDZ99DRAFT_273350 [Mytilinidion resinicola]KAF2812763.1 hypothetical protein BDZ99DRAFT_273350 [Mytilinidion resinicola]